MANTLLAGAGLENYPHLFPPPGFIPFRRSESITVASGASLSLIANSLVLIPTQMDGWISTLGVDFSDTAAGSWSLLVNGTGIRDYTGLNSFVGSPQTPTPVYIRLAPSQAVQLAFTNTGTGAMAASYDIFGWYYPRS